MTLTHLQRVAGRWYEYATNPRRRASFARVGWQLVPRIAGGVGIAFVQQVGNASTVASPGTALASTAATFAAGNLLVAIVSWAYSGAGASGTIDVPSGWTAPLVTKNNGAPNGCSRVYYMPNNPGGSQSWTWNITMAGGGTSQGNAYTIFEFSGVASSSPLDLTAVNNATAGASSTSLDSTAASGTTIAGDLLLELVAVQRSAAGTLTTDTTNSVPTTSWNVGTQFQGTNAVPNAHAGGQYQVLAGTQASPRGVLTSSISESSESWLVTFKAAVSAAVLPQARSFDGSRVYWPKVAPRRSVLPLPQSTNPPNPAQADAWGRRHFVNRTYARKPRRVDPTLGQAAVVGPSFVNAPRTIRRRVGFARRARAWTWFLTVQLGLNAWAKIQTGVTSFSTGVNYAETDVYWVDRSSNGWMVGALPTYGAGVISPFYEIDAGVVGITQTSLSTSQQDGFVHMEAVIGSNFKGSEQFAYTLAEIGPAGIAQRRYWDSGTSGTDVNGLQWRVRQCIQPGDPGIIFTRIDMINPSGSGIVLNGASDAADYDPIAGLTQVLQGGVIAWQAANGGYGFVGGANTTPWPTVYTAGDPDYYYITPQSGSGLSLGLVGVRKTLLTTISGASGIQFAAVVNANRMKMNVKITSGATVPANTTLPFFFASFIRRSLTQADAISMAADYLNPDASSIVSIGAAGSPFWSDDEGCYVITAAGNAVQLTHTISGNVTGRWLPFYKISNWQPSQLPIITLKGVALSYDVDYEAWVDTTNSVLYVKFLKEIVASGAGAGQLNNGALFIGASVLPAWVPVQIRAFVSRRLVAVRRARRFEPPWTVVAPTAPTYASWPVRARRAIAWPRRRPQGSVVSDNSIVGARGRRSLFGFLRKSRRQDPPIAQATAPANPSFVDFVRRRLSPKAFIRRGERYEPPWPQATAPGNPAFADWWRRRFQWKAWPLRRPRSSDVPREQLGLTVSKSGRRQGAGPRRGRRFEPPWSQIQIVAPAFVEFWRRQRLSQQWLRPWRARLFQPPWVGAIGSSLQLLAVTGYSRAKTVIGKSRALVATGISRAMKIIGRTR